MRRRRRLLHAGVLAAAGVAGGLVAWSLLPSADPGTQRLSLILGYESLAAVLVTLALGPLQVLRHRPNPVSSDLRRDVGLCAGLTAAGHVVFSVQHHFGGHLVRYFFTSHVGLSSVRTDTFGKGVWIGLIATVVVLGLTAISNDLALRTLGRRWKALQRTNYALAVLAVVHTVLFWDLLDRSAPIRLATIGLLLAVLVLQASGFAAVLVRRRHAAG